MHADNLINAVTELNRKFNAKMSIDATQYRLMHSNLNPEIYVVIEDTNSFARMGVTFWDWKVMLE